MAIPLLDSLDLTDKDITADALLTQRKVANYLVDLRHAHYHFTVKANQPTLLDDLRLFFQDRKQPDFVMHDPPVFDFTEGTHPISTKGTTQFSGAKRRSYLDCLQ